MRVYRINRIDAPPIYKASVAEVYAWAKRNPGEMQSWENMDAVEELNKIGDQLFETERQADKYRRRMNDAEIEANDLLKKLRRTKS